MWLCFSLFFLCISYVVVFVYVCVVAKRTPPQRLQRGGGVYSVLRKV